MDWTAFRWHFPVAARWAFLDHAAVAPLPDVAGRALEEYGRSLAENGVAAVKDWVDRLAHVRRLAARLVNAPDADDVYFVPNTTHGIGVVAEGFPWQPGDNVVLAAEEYPANQYPWMNLAGRGVTVRVVPSRGGRLSIDDLRAAMDARTRVLTVSSVEFASGFRNDLDALGELCRQRGVFFFVDAIQSLGAFPLDVQRTPVDALAADGHKWMLGPEGAGFGYVRREWVDRLHPIGVGAFSVVRPFEFSMIDFTLKPHAGRWEGGAPNVPGITAFGASLELLLSAGIENVARRVLELTDYLCGRAASAGLAVFSSRAAGEKSGIVSLVKPGVPANVLVKACRAAGVVVNNRAGRVRVSPHAYNTFDDLDRFLEVVRGAGRSPPVATGGPGAIGESDMPNRVLSHRVAVYTGTFDPIHLGHLDIIRRGSRMFDRLIVGVGINPEKASMFTPDERVELVRRVTTDLDNVEVQRFDGLAVRYVREAGAALMLRGLRTTSDMEYEFTMSLMNLNLDSGIETVFLMAREEFSHLTSTLLRQIAVLGGDSIAVLSKFLPEPVKQALVEKARQPR